MKRAGGIFANLFGPQPPRFRFTFEELAQLYGTLVKNPVVNDANRSIVVETIRSVAEFILWGDQNEPKIFDYFLENNVMLYMHKVLTQPGNRGGDVAKQVLQTLSIIIQNVKSETAVFFLFSNNHVNNIIEVPFDFEDEEVMGFYISFLKAISLKLNNRTVQFFVETPDGGPIRLPLFAQAVKFAHHKEGMVRAGVRTLTLKILDVADPMIQAFLTTSPVASHYFADAAQYLLEQIRELAKAMVAAHNMTPTAMASLDGQVAEVEDVLAYFADVFGTSGLPLLSHHVAQHIWTTVVGPALLKPLLALCRSSGSSGGGSFSNIAAAAAAASTAGADVPTGKLPAPADAAPLTSTNVAAACAFYTLERMFQLVSYEPLLHNILFVLFDSAYVKQQQQQQQERDGGSSSSSGASAPPPPPVGISSCRQAILGVLTGSNYRLATNCVRMLVAVVYNKYVDPRALYSLGLLPRAQFEIRDLETGSKVDVFVAAAERSGSAGKLSPGRDGAPAQTVAGPYKFAYQTHFPCLGVRSRRSTAEVPFLTPAAPAPAADRALSMSASVDAAAAAAAAGPADAVGDLIDIGNTPPPPPPPPPEPSAPSPPPPPPPPPLTGDLLGDLSDDDTASGAGQAVPERSAALAEAADGDDGGAVRSTSHFTPMPAVQLTGAPSTSHPLEDSPPRGSSQTYSSAMAGGGGGRGSDDGQLVSEAITGLQTMALFTPPPPPPPHEQQQPSLGPGSDSLLDGLSGGGRPAAAGSPRSPTQPTPAAARTAATSLSELVDALLCLLQLQLLPVSNLCQVGFLVHQLAANASADRDTPSLPVKDLTPRQQQLVVAAVAAAQVALVAQIQGMWCEAILPLVTFEWPLCRSAVLKPELRASADTLMFGPHLYPQPGSDLASQGGVARPGHGLSMSGLAALQAYHAVQRAVAMAQIQQLVVRGGIGSEPETQPVSEEQLKRTDVTEGQQVDLSAGHTVPCIVSFAPGQERRVQLAIAGITMPRLADSSPNKASRQAVASLLQSSAAVVLADVSGGQPTVGTAVAVAPLLGADAQQDKSVAKWLHIHVRPSVRGLLRVLRNSHSKRGGAMTALRHLADGHWVLAFVSGETAAAAVLLIDQHSAKLRALYCSAIDPLMRPLLSDMLATEAAVPSGGGSATANQDGAGSGSPPSLI